MLHDFLSTNRSELIGRCRTKVAQRRAPRATPGELEHGVPLFLDQLVQMLPAMGDDAETSHAGDRRMSIAEDKLEDDATRHGGELLRHDFTIDQVVHDYGDLCQSITELAFEQGAPITVREFGILNITLDNAIAGAVSEYAWQHERAAGRNGMAASGERLGHLANEMRNFLNTAILAVAAIRSGSVGSTGATAAALDRSLMGMRGLIDRTLAEVRLGSDSEALSETFELGPFVADVQVAAALEASTLGCELAVLAVEPGIFVRADRHILAAAVSNLLHNAFRYARGNGHVVLSAHARDRRAYIEIEDGAGLPQELLGALFRPHDKQSAELGGGPGIAVSRKGVEANGGQLYVRNVPGRDCVVTIEMPRES
jgi:signal transduction histidine kinase